MNMQQNSGFGNLRHSGKLAIKCVLLRNVIYSTFLLQFCYFTSDSAVHFLIPSLPPNIFSQYFHLLKLTDVHTLLLGCTVPKSFHIRSKLMLTWLLSYCHQEKVSIGKKSPLKKKKSVWTQQVQIFYPKVWKNIQKKDENIKKCKQNILLFSILAAVFIQNTKLELFYVSLLLLLN